jgi:hypothetical protein
MFDTRVRTAPVCPVSLKILAARVQRLQCFFEKMKRAHVNKDLRNRVSKTGSFPTSITILQTFWQRTFWGVTLSEYFSGFQISVKFCVCDNHMLKN